MLRNGDGVAMLANLGFTLWTAYFLKISAVGN
jgi:hypothetical protein